MESTISSSVWNSLITGMGNKRMESLGFMPFLTAVGISLLCALFVSWLYGRFCGARGTGSQVHRAFPLLGVSVTSIFIAIQFSLPLSLGLLGALSIVRFRTPIKEPEEIGFIMLVIATSLCCATFNLFFLSIILLVAVAALLVQAAVKRRAWWSAGRDGMLVMTLPASDYRAHTAELGRRVAVLLPSIRLESVTECGAEVAVTFAFREGAPLTPPSFEALRQLTPDLRVQLFYRHAGEV